MRSRSSARSHRSTGIAADAALYWKAYAQNKEGQQARALETCADLGHTYSKSRWISECDALRIEIRGASGHPVQPQSTPDDDLKLLALQAIMQQDEARAMPAIQQILNGNGSEKLKETALFVLANSNYARGAECDWPDCARSV